MRHATGQESAEIDHALEEAVKRGLALRVDSLEKVLAVIAWFSADRPADGLASRIHEALLPRKDGYCITVIPATGAMPAGKVVVFPGSTDNGGPTKRVVTVVVSVAATWRQLGERLREA